MASGGTPPYTYYWSNGETTEAITGLLAGSYSLTVTDANFCTIEGTWTVNQPDDLMVSGTVVDVLCNGGSDGSITLSVSGGTLPYAFLWNDGNTDQDRTGLTAGLYNVTVTDANSCEEFAEFTVEEPDALGVTAVVEDALCHTSCDGTITISVTGGIAPYTYLWDSGQTTESIDNLCAGIYTVTITDFNGCTLSDFWVINAPEELTDRKSVV